MSAVHDALRDTEPTAVIDESDGDDNETASQKSISLSSPAVSPRHSTVTPAQTHFTPPSPPLNAYSKRDSRPYTIDTDLTSETDNSSFYTHELGTRDSSISSAAASLYEQEDHSKLEGLTTYPPPPLPSASRESVTSFSSRSSSYSKKARPESTIFEVTSGPLILGIALVDFNHLVGPKIEFSKGEIFEDEEIAKILPFLALPDGAHLTVEDYSYFHLVPSSPKPTTIFGISCNRQIAASQLLVKDADVTRSTVQKAVVILASKPVFGLVRDRLGVITRALFDQRDFRETDILVDFYDSLEPSLRSQLTESGVYMGTSLRELVHHFRQKTLVIIKALMLQKKVMFYGHPVERLCTYQYSLISLIPGLLHTLDDSGSPPLANRAPTLTRPSSLKTSNHKSMMAYLGLPLDIFGKDSFFQPYLPLQQLDMLRETPSWLCGTTNSIVTSQKCVDLLINIETASFEFRDPTLERMAGLTAADRKWMDEIVKDVNDGWNDEDPTRPLGMQFKGSDDYLRSKFEEYISGALSSVKFADFIAKGEGGGVMITGGTGADYNAIQDYNPLWIAEFKKTNAYEVWQRVTDPTLFDIVEPRHPCNEKPSVVADISLRLSEGIQELKLDQQLAPAREAVSRTLVAGSTNFFKAVEGVRGRWAQRSAGSSTSIQTVSSSSSSTVEVASPPKEPTSPPAPAELTRTLSQSPPPADGQRPISLTAADAKAALGSIGAGIGSFFSSRASRFSLGKPATAPEDAATASKDASLTASSSTATVVPASSSTATVVASPTAVTHAASPTSVTQVASATSAAHVAEAPSVPSKTEHVPEPALAAVQPEAHVHAEEHEQTHSTQGGEHDHILAQLDSAHAPRKSDDQSIRAVSVYSSEGEPAGMALAM
ncbi:hypothetical protein GLOTRDRAFT_141142 [Gloeophyllum trabeum ATCC 11539]|uniref:UDENN domain-containing protein n=1 Tax=Gloeophyllum trabeum (strain ATCC 11539 / FP-39264 / Madison 617) TaxID=670483 RepID=S7PU69_GLOTA|nr:uncharacterized protein GLOTRDRAFT_141142 [Gloeophyllum trabeum ATCC 11539]EPQ50978.1 hypothetical protein GLOTRDRAFT_141142 [Gloeophyllum trabeum ATCC 11539]